MLSIPSLFSAAVGGNTAVSVGGNTNDVNTVIAGATGNYGGDIVPNVSPGPPPPVFDDAAEEKKFERPQYPYIPHAPHISIDSFISGRPVFATGVVMDSSGHGTGVTIPVQGVIMAGDDANKGKGKEEMDDSDISME